MVDRLALGASLQLATMLHASEGSSLSGPSISESSTSDRAGSRKTSTDASNPLTYGRDLWDSLAALTENTSNKTHFMKALKTFFISYKKGFEQLGQTLTKANLQFEKDFIVKSGNTSANTPTDTLSTAMLNLKMVVDDLTHSILLRGDSLQKDIVEPLESYYKHYNTANVELLRQASGFWSNLHGERTTMLFAKENYYNQMQNLSSYQQSITDAPPIVEGDKLKGLPEDSPYFQHDKKLLAQQTKADNSKSEYEKALNKLNATIESFDTHYRPILRRIQDNDDSQIAYMKHNFEKLAQILEEVGKDFTRSGDDILQSSSKISADTDLKIFIGTYRTQNPYLQPEDFQVFENIKAEVVVKGRKGTFSEDTTPWPDPNLKKNSQKNIELSNSQGQSNRRGSKLSSIGSAIFGNEDTNSSERKNSDDFQKLAMKDGFFDEREYLFDKLQMLLSGTKALTSDEKGLLIQLISQKEPRATITEVLNEINAPKHLEVFECQQDLAEILRHLLSLFLQEKSTDYKLLYTIIESSQNIFTSIHNRKHFLSGLLCEHPIWQDEKRWRSCIQDIVTMKVEEAAKRKKNKGTVAAALGKKEDKESNFFKKGFKSLKGILTSKDKLLQQEMKTQQNLIFNEMSRFVQSFINFGLPYDQANQILIHYCNQFQLEQSRVHLLLTELVSNQKNPSQMFTDKEQLIWSLQRRGNRLKAFGFSDRMQIVGMTIRFLDDDTLLLKILLLCKDFNDLLKDEILKQSLLRASKNRLKNKRPQLWLRILDIDPGYAEQEYQKYLKQSQTEALPSLVAGAIEVDVNRSFNHLGKITGDNLNNILKAYAVCNPHNLDYCQGMNFIAGFLFLLFNQNEALAFSVLRELISRFHMSALFNSELPMLKLNFYQLDRLISIVLPDLHRHFKQENISSSFYSAPYFITLFTSVLQNQTSEEGMDRLLRLWDYFIINGWKSIFKVSLLILKDFEDQLLAMPFEVLLTQVVSMPMKYFIKECESDQHLEEIEGFDRSMNSLKIPTMLLERLKKEFDENYHISMMTSSAQDKESKRNSNRQSS